MDQNMDGNMGRMNVDIGNMGGNVERMNVDTGNMGGNVERMNVDTGNMGGDVGRMNVDTGDIGRMNGGTGDMGVDMENMDGNTGKNGRKSMGGNMDILVVEPGKAPRPASVPATLEAMESILGGPVQVGCFLLQRVLLVSREDVGGLVPNRCMPDRKSCIRGTFLLCGVPEEGSGFASLTPARQAEFGGIFAAPGEFMAVGGAVYADPDDVADAVYGLWDTLRDGDTVVLKKWGGQVREVCV